ncbi:MAG: hypothetical protein ACRBCI_11410 [Cellvibrionaceae bacterium]
MSAFITNRVITPLATLTRYLVVCVISILISACGGGAGIGGGGDSDGGSDPLLIETGIAYVKRPVPVDEDGEPVSFNILTPAAFNGGARLYLREQNTRSADEIAISDAAFGAGALYDVKDVEVSYDGSKLLFSMRAPEVEGEDEPTWNLWEYDVISNTLEPVIKVSDNAERGHDIGPAYLPDGRIVFSSTRQVRSRAILLSELSGGGYAATTADRDGDNLSDEIFNLHIIDPINDANGNRIEQITFGQDHELQPTVLSDGRIAYLRHNTSDNRDNITLYTINIDGSNARLLYGYHNQTTGNTAGIDTTFVDFREVSDGSLGAILRQRDSATLGGDIVRVKINDFIDINQPTNDNSGDTSAGHSSVTIGTVNLGGDISTHGYFNSAYAYPGNPSRYLVSWNLCRLQDPDTLQIISCNAANINDPNLEPAPPFYQLINYDTSTGTQDYVDLGTEGEMFSDVVIVDARQSPGFSTANPGIIDSLESNELGLLHIRSVYDFNGSPVNLNDGSTLDTASLADPAQTSADARPARFIRLVKAVSIPEDFDRNNNAFGLGGSEQNRGMRQILGYAPIEPDGSVKAEVPSDVAFYFDILNADGERIDLLDGDNNRTRPIHRHWLYLKGGETFECTGCHTDDSETPHGRLDAEAPSINQGGIQDTPFPNTELIFVDEGDTMAEVAYKNPNPSISKGLSTGLVYTDYWTDDSGSLVKNDDYGLTYNGAGSSFAPLTTTAPVSTDCQNDWNSSCRTIINYVDHIQPLWETNRPGGSCISCHTRGTMAAPAAPGGQLGLISLEFEDTPALPTPTDEYYSSYEELFTLNRLPFLIGPNGERLTIYTYAVDNNGAAFNYVDETGAEIIDPLTMQPIRAIREAQLGDTNLRVQEFSGNDPVFYLDIDGNPIDPFNNIPNIVDTPIPRTLVLDNQFLPSPPVMSNQGASSSRFFNALIDNGNLVDHSDMMSPNELRLLREWLDIGAQYYNNPLDSRIAN